MNINELVMFPTQLTHVETVRFHAEKMAAKVKSEFSISAEVKGEVLDEKTGRSNIIIKVENEDYYIEEEKIGIFEFEETIEDERLAIQFMEVQGVRILWSYIREDLYSISSKMLPRPIMIPTIDVMQTLEKAE